MAADGQASDGDDVLFGDLGNDWIVGGTGRDHAYGGFGSDLLNLDDDHSTDGGLNQAPDSFASYADIGYGGAGRDVLLANTGADRLIDWSGEFNSYLVPFGPFGGFTVSRSPQPQIREYLYELSAADGADPTRIVDGGAARRGEPYGELGLVAQQDPFWQDQTGAPVDPQPGNIPGGRRDVVSVEDFNGQASLVAFAADTGIWTLDRGKLVVQPQNLGEDAVSVYHLENPLPSYFELLATINGGKPIGGLKSNSYLIFDYQDPTDFKFAGLNVAINKLQIGHRTADGWIVDVQSPARLKPDRDYQVKVAVNGLNVTVVVDGDERALGFMTHTFEPRIVDGFAYGINAGMVGLGADNSVARLDNLMLQVLPVEYTFEQVEDLADGSADLFTGEQRGTWTVTGETYVGTVSGTTGYSLVDLSSELGLPANQFAVASNSFLQLGAIVHSAVQGGFVFDFVTDERFKFVTLDSNTGEVAIGHFTTRDGWATDASFVANINGGHGHEFEVSLKGSTVSVQLDGQTVVGHAFDAVVVDGRFGVLTHVRSTTFEEITVSTDDPAFGANRSGSTPGQGTSGHDLTVGDVGPVSANVIRSWSESRELAHGALSGRQEIHVEIPDVVVSTLGRTVENAVSTDVSVAEHRWYIDATPAGVSRSRFWFEDVVAAYVAAQ